MAKPAHASTSATEWDRDAALTTAQILLEIKAVNFRPEEPYTLTSGWKSPVYIDCRKIIFFPRARAKICDLAVEKIGRYIGYEAIQAVAGGETAGIPFAAWISERLSLPMLYIRKKPKGFGRMAQIEGHFHEGDRVLLVEDLASEGTSKLNFIQAIRAAEGVVTDTFVIFHYGIFPSSVTSLEAEGVKLHALATWHDVLDLADRRGSFTPPQYQAIKSFLDAPDAWVPPQG